MPSLLHSPSQSASTILDAQLSITKPKPCQPRTSRALTRPTPTPHHDRRCMLATLARISHEFRRVQMQGARCERGLSHVECRAIRQSDTPPAGGRIHPTGLVMLWYSLTPITSAYRVPSPAGALSDTSAMKVTSDETNRGRKLMDRPPTAACAATRFSGTARFSF